MLTPELSGRIRTWLQLYDREGRVEEGKKKSDTKIESQRQQKQHPKAMEDISREETPADEQRSQTAIRSKA
jgi:hypothetical protein